MSECARWMGQTISTCKRGDLCICPAELQKMASDFFIFGSSLGMETKEGCRRIPPQEWRLYPDAADDKNSTKCSK